MKMMRNAILIILFLLGLTGTSQDLQLNVQLLPPAQLGDNAMFNVIIRNYGQELVTGVQSRITLKDGLEYVSNDPTNAEYNPEDGLWYVGSLEKYQAKVLTVVARYKAKVDAVLMAEITRSLATDPDSTPGNGIDTNGNGEIIHDKGDEDDGDAAEINIPY